MSRNENGEDGRWEIGYVSLTVRGLVPRSDNVTHSILETEAGTGLPGPHGSMQVSLDEFNFKNLPKFN